MRAFELAVGSPHNHSEMITGLKVALLLNFKESRLTWKRVVNEKRGAPGSTDIQLR